MSQENVEIVRKPLRVRERSSRTLDQRLGSPLPSAAPMRSRSTDRVVCRPTSRVRQAAVWRGTRLAMEAFNRRDVDAACYPYGHPDFEYPPAARVRRGGVLRALLSRSSGLPRLRVDLVRSFRSDLRIEPVELIDLGDRVVLLADLHVRAQASGVPFTGKIATVSDAQAREGDPRTDLPRPRRSPRSRGAGGVGDVAGERGGGAVALRRWCNGATRNRRLTCATRTSAEVCRDLPCPTWRRYIGGFDGLGEFWLAWFAASGRFSV